MSANATAETDGPYVLWFRPTGRHKWRVVGRGRTPGEALARMKGSGDYYVLPAGLTPGPKKII